MLLVSACLAGVKCKYNAGDNYDEAVAGLVREGKAILVCPEQLGGLCTPRKPAEIIQGSGQDVLLSKAGVVTEDGQDVTAAFLRGAVETLKIAQLVKARGVILKDGSPSCGSKLIYDGSFKGLKKRGEGVTAALLKNEGYPVFSEQTDLKRFLEEGG